MEATEELLKHGIHPPFPFPLSPPLFQHTHTLGVGGVDKYSTSVFLEKILRYYYIPTTGVAEWQAPLNNMLRSS